MVGSTRGPGGDRWPESGRILGTAGFVLSVMVGACGEAADGPGPQGEARTNPFLGDGRVAELQLSEEFELDLTGDRVHEEVVVSVHGDHPTALEMELTVFGTGDGILYGSAWSSSDYPEFRQAGGRDLPAWVASQAVRERLQDLLDDDSLRPLQEDEIDVAALRWELQLEEWRRERGVPASVPLTPEEEAEAARIQIPQERMREIEASLPGRPALRYLAGASFRTIVWSPDLGRFLTVYSCC